jgi:ferritin-like metal-binding protein YciE
MKLVSEKIRDLEALYVRHLRLLLSAEELIAIKTPFLSDMTSDPESREVLRSYALNSRDQAGHLRAMVERATSDTDPIKCQTVYALFDESEDLMNDASHDEVRNAVVIAAAQRIKHYEIAMYESTAHYAQLLGRANDARVLTAISEEERREELQLRKIADRVNGTAQQAA